MQARRSIPLAVGALAAAAIALGGVLIGTLVHDDGGASKAKHATGSATAHARAKTATPGQPGAAPVSVEAQQVRGSFASATHRRQRASKAARRRAAKARARKRRAAARRARKSSAGAAIGEGGGRRRTTPGRATTPVRLEAPVRQRARAPRRHRTHHPLHRRTRRAPAVPAPAPPVVAAPAPPAARPHGRHRGRSHRPWWWMRHGGRGRGHAYGHARHGRGR